MQDNIFIYLCYFFIFIIKLVEMLMLLSVLSVCWISRSLQSKLRLGTGSSSSLTDLSPPKASAGGAEKGGNVSGLADDCSRDKGTQQRRAGANATWNR